MRRKKILAITGIRSEYDILYPVLKILNEDDEFDLKIVVSGAHLSYWHGLTLEKIIDDGFEIVDKIDSLFMTNRDIQRPKGVGVLTMALSQTVEREDPDFLLVVGDREESIAAAIVGNYLKKLVVHIGGGDIVYGNADDTTRFAVSELAHIHLTLAQEFSENLIRLGEDDFRIFNTGHPALDNILNTADISHTELCDRLDLALKPKAYIVLIYHPLSSEMNEAGKQMKVVLEASHAFCKKYSFKLIGSYPNTDPGAYDIINVIETYKQSETVNFYKTLPRDIFVNVIRGALMLLGNSSMGFFEAPFYQLPVVNVGKRQMGRLNAGHVSFVNVDQEDITAGLERACLDKSYRQRVQSLVNPFGDGHAAENIKQVLSNVDLGDHKWYVKQKHWD